MKHSAGPRSVHVIEATRVSGALKVAFVLLSAVAPVVLAADNCPPGVIRATVRIEREGAQASGVIVGPSTILTAGHLVWGQPLGTRYQVYPWAGGEYSAYLLALPTPDMDCALLALASGALPWVARFGRDPAPGDGLWVAGWPRGQGSVDEGHAGRLADADAEAMPRDALIIASIYPGHSGAGVWDRRGHLVGLVWGVSEVCERHGIYVVGSSLAAFVRMHAETDHYELDPPEWTRRVKEVKGWRRVDL